MRLFIAINFNSETKENILKVQSRLKECSTGSFSRPENIHLTLAFLGEVEPAGVEIIKHAMNSISVPKMQIIFDHIGYFKRRDTAIYGGLV